MGQHRVAGVSALVVGLAAASAAVGQANSRCTALDRAGVLQQANAARARGAVCGTRGSFAPSAALTWNEQLQGAADKQARWLAELGSLAHSGPDGETLRERAAAVGYRYGRIAENVAQGQRSVAQVLAGWTASEAHCVNLYDTGVNEMALACAPGRDGRPFWVLLLGRPL